MAMMPSSTALRVGLGEVVDGDVGAARPVRAAAAPSTLAADALEDRDLVGVDADVVLLHAPTAGRAPPAAASTSTTAATAAMMRSVGRLRRSGGRRVRARRAAGAAGSSWWRDARAGRGVGRRALVAAVAGGAADDRGVVAEVDVDDVGDDAGDVVRAAAAQRQLDQPVGALARVAVGGSASRPASRR